MSRTSRTLVALVVAAMVLVIAAWFDTAVMRDAQQQAGATFGPTGVITTRTLGSLLIAGSALLLGVLAWRSASVVVGLAYIVVGGFFVVLPWLFWTFGVQTNGLPPGAPEPLASIIRHIDSWTAGSLDTVTTIGAAMLIAGVAALVRWWRDRAVAPSRAGVVVPTADPTLP
jgi:hypothetical protein